MEITMHYVITTNETVTKTYHLEADDPQEAIRLALEDTSHLEHEEWGMERIEVKLRPEE